MSGVPTFAGTMDEYLRHVAEENAIARVDRERRENAKTDPREQCGHGVSLYENCTPCGLDVTS